MGSQIVALVTVIEVASAVANDHVQVVRRKVGPTNRRVRGLVDSEARPAYT